MKIVIVGYGKMGIEVEKQAQNLSIEISKILKDLNELKSTTFDKDEIAIEFSTPNSAVENIEILARQGVSVVCGTTGWNERESYVQNLVKKSQIGFLPSSNFSLGVNLFWKILEHSSKLVNNFLEYDVYAHEIHHKNKKDSPSGTAISMGDILLRNIDRKKHIVTEKLTRELKENEIHLSSTRGGNVIGDHTVVFDSICDSIQITHSSKGRSSYAIGALKCAKWLSGKKGYYTINDYIKDLIHE